MMEQLALVTRPRSIVSGADQECISQLLTLHTRPDARIVDVTYGEGRMWEGLPYKPMRFLGDFRELPQEWTRQWDVVVFDPPHVTEAGKKSRYYTRFDTGHVELANKADISHLFLPFLLEAHRVLGPRGIVLAKISDQVHRGRYRWQMVDFITAVRQTQEMPELQPRFNPCDMQIKEERRAETLTGSNWERVRHTRRAHVYWIVVRKGKC